MSTNEVDAGILNLTEALNAGEKIGGYIEIPQNLYTPIEIVAGSLDTCSSRQSVCFVFNVSLFR